jgi:kynurenine formamidase
VFGREAALSEGAPSSARPYLVGLRRSFARLSASVAALAVLIACGPAERPSDPPLSLSLDTYRLVDLTHAFGEDTVYWPTATTKFQLEQLAYGQTDAGYFYAAYSLCTPEHGGTHLDAPIHFAEGQQTTGQIPLERLVRPAVVIDIGTKSQTTRDYQLSREDVVEFEREHGQIERDAIVLLRTGWSRYWPNVKAYLGDDTPGDASKLSFPSYGEDAARLLFEERQIAALGVDTASIDIGRSQDFRVHRIAAARGVPGLENLTNLDQLPPRGAIVAALPMKIAHGSGGPLRAIALVPKS